MTKKNFISLFFTICFLIGAAQASAAAYAWSEKLGLIDMSNVSLNDFGLTGYATTVPEKIDFNLADYTVRTDNNGNLSGTAYNDRYGTISFSGIQVQKDGSLSGYANGAKLGKIIFDCSTSNCGGISTEKYIVNWRPASLLEVNKSLLGGHDFAYVVDDIFRNMKDLGSISRSQNVEIRAGQDFYIIYKRLPENNSGDKYLLKILAYDGIDERYTNDAAKQKLARDFFAKNYQREPSGDVDERVLKALVYFMGMPGTNPLKSTTTPAVSNSSTTSGSSLAQTTNDSSTGHSYTGSANTATQATTASVGTYQPATTASVSTAANTTKTTNTKVLGVKISQAKVFKNDLRYGNNHADVGPLKQALAKLGFYKSKNQDNKFDNNLKNALVSFQKKYNLKCTGGKYCGVFGPQTRAKLNTLLDKAK